jgi:hypothetical protein
VQHRGRSNETSLFGAESPRTVLKMCQRIDVDATQPLNQVVDELLRVLRVHPRSGVVDRGWAVALSARDNLT